MTNKISFGLLILTALLFPLSAQNEKTFDTDVFKKETWNKEKTALKESKSKPQEIMEELHLNLIRNILKVDPLTETELKEIEIITKSCIENDLKKALNLSYFTTAKIYHALREPNVALQYLKLSQSSKIKIDVIDLPLLYAQLYSETGNYLKSNEILENLIRDTPIKERFNLNSLHINNLMALKHFKKAIGKLLELNEQKLDTNYRIDVLNKLAICYISTSRTEDGIEAYRNAIALTNGKNDVQKEQVKKSFSKALRSNKRDEENVSLIRESFQSLEKPKNTLEYLRLAESYFSLNKINDAAKAINKYIDSPNYSIIDLSEIEVIRNTARKLENDQMARKFLNFYTILEDTIAIKRTTLQLKGHSKGMENLIQLETLRKEKEISQNAIQSLMKEDALKEDVLSASKWAIGFLLGLILIGCGAVLYILKVSKQRRIANQKLALRSLRSQMNPHFIFNALNSVNSFISENDQRSANKFLTNFSKLMRLVMENSEYDFIPLHKELEILELYLKLEHFRFKDQFEYSFTVHKDIDEENFNIPPMLVQPYIENAVWHGLRYKKDSGNLKLDLAKNDQNLIITIEDNGIGRKRSAELKTHNQKKNKSTALRNIKQRINIINDLNGIHVDVSTYDLNQDGTGTVVKLIIPQQKLKTL